MRICRLSNDLAFPSPDHSDPEGLVAVGGDLGIERLLLAYRTGIFPWYSEGQPILWWSPDPRCVLYPDRLHISRTLGQLVRSGRFAVSIDRAFRDVVEECGAISRRGQDGTWITAEMQDAYHRLHREGYAHSVEVWRDGRLVGGLYGVALGRVFCGESMFSREPNASKVGLVGLVNLLQRHGFRLIDCQIHSEHLERLGAELVPRRRFLGELAGALGPETLRGDWGELGAPGGEKGYPETPVSSGSS